MFLEEAIKEAKLSEGIDEVPVGAVIVKDNKIIGRGHNLKEKLQDCTAHAEILAIRDAGQNLDSWRLSDCELYVTLEPCAMCAGAILGSRIKKVYIGAFDPTAGACGSVINVLQNDALNKWTEVIWLYDKECSRMLSDYFKAKREKRL
ncbi:MAG: tRNA adenosine(34) deaminase TadA [Clostridiaceae bacterium]